MTGVDVWMCGGVAALVLQATNAGVRRPGYEAKL